jgi:hypothetical protein
MAGMNGLSPSQASSRRPAPLPARLAALIAAPDLAGAGPLHLPAHLAPSRDERRALEQRAAELEVSLAPYTDEARVQSRIVALRLVMPSTTGGESAADRAMALRLYAHALARFPEWIVGEACARFIDGRAGSGRFAPTPAELAAECDAIAAPLHAERHRAARLAAAGAERPVAEAERERVAAGFAALLAEIAAASTPLRPTPGGA